MTYTDEFLISELHRFVEENGRNPLSLDMRNVNGYPSRGTYENYFGTWNNALIEAGLKINKIKHSGILDRTETCSHCDKRAIEIPGFINWYYDKNNDKRHCNKCGDSSGIYHYKKGILDINCSTGRGRAGEITVIKTLNIGNEYDCNRLSCGYPFDMYHKEYEKINVKTSVLNNKYNTWQFNFNKKQEAKTYICLGMSSDTKQVEHVWAVTNINEIKDLTILTIYDTYGSLRNRSKWEVDFELYDKAWKEMLDDYTNGKCKVFGKKEKEEWSEERQQRYEQFKKDFLERHNLNKK